MKTTEEFINSPEATRAESMLKFYEEADSENSTVYINANEAINRFFADLTQREAMVTAKADDFRKQISTIETQIEQKRAYYVDCLAVNEAKTAAELRKEIDTLQKQIDALNKEIDLISCKVKGSKQLYAEAEAAISELNENNTRHNRNVNIILAIAKEQRRKWETIEARCHGFPGTSPGRTLLQSKLERFEEANPNE